jgi:hypothetical protein
MQRAARSATEANGAGRIELRCLNCDAVDPENKGGEMG